MEQLEQIYQLLPLVPQHLQRQFIEGPGQLMNWEQYRYATILFADVSGFTAMSEALLRQDQSGAEYLTQILNQYFFTMINTVNQYQGSIAKFGGDSLTILFPHSDAYNYELAAIHCAKHMMQNMGLLSNLRTPAGTFELLMKCGLAFGKIYETVLGTPNTQMEYIVAGEPLDIAARAENLAARKEIILHDDFFERVKHDIAIGVKQTDYLVFKETHKFPRLPLALPPNFMGLEADDQDYVLQALKSFAHPSQFETLFSGGVGFTGEHRNIAVVFLSFQGIPYKANQLQQFYTHLYQTIKRYNGYVNKLDMGDKGAKALLLFGAPRSDGKERTHALHAVEELIRQNPMKLVLKAGINWGHAYCGWIGGVYRKEYTAIGDTVNTAARLMVQANRNQILCIKHTQQTLETMATWESQGMVQFKGKLEPLEVFDLLEVTDAKETIEKMPFVGRKTEIQTISQRLERCRFKSGWMIAIQGESGIGKTRLIEELIPKAHLAGYLVLSGGFDHMSTPYDPIKQIIAQEAGIERHHTDRERQLRYKTYFEHHIPELSKFIPVLIQTLGEDFPHSGFTQKLNQAHRHQLIFHGLERWLIHLAEQQPVMLIIEDMHYSDEDTRLLLNHLLKMLHSNRILMFCTYRPMKPFLQTGSKKRITELKLDSLSWEEQLELWELIGLSDIDERIIKLANGIPLYIEELVKHVLNKGDDSNIPDSLQSLITARLDFIGKTAEEVLKVCSVIGTEFDIQTLLAIYPTPLTDAQIKEAIEEGERHNIIIPVDVNDQEYSFRHVLLRDTAYSLISESLKNTLHHALGSYVVRTSGGGSDWKRAAWHFTRAGDLERAKEWYHRSGEWFYKRGEAEYLDCYLHYFNVVKTPLENKPQATHKDELEMLYRIGKGYLQIGSWEHAISYLVHLKVNADQIHDEEYLGAALNQLGECYWRLDRIVDVEMSAQQALQLKGTLTQARAHLNMGRVLLQRSHYLKALHHFERSLSLFRQLDYSSGEATVLSFVGHVYKALGNLTHGLSFYQHSLQLHQAQKNQTGQVMALYFIGLMYLDMGNYDLAFEYHEQQLKQSQAIRDFLGEAQALNTLGYLHTLKGEFLVAEKRIATAIGLMEEERNKRVDSQAHFYLGINDFYQGNYDLALEKFQIAAELTRTIQFTEQIPLILSYIAQIYLRTDQVEKALSLLERAYEIIRSIGYKPQESTMLFLIGLAYLYQKNLNQTHEYWTSSYHIVMELEYSTLIYQLYACMISFNHLSHQERFATIMIQELEEKIEFQKSKQMIFTPKVYLEQAQIMKHKQKKDLQALINHVSEQGAIGLKEELCWWLFNTL
jgi:adenylate cyclase